MLPIILVIKDKDDQNYVADVYEKYKTKLYKVAYDILKHDEDAKDCVQDVIIVLIDHLQEYQAYSPTHKINFLYVCCRNIAITKYRKSRDKIDLNFQ